MFELTEQIMQEHKVFIPYPMCSNWSIDPGELITGEKCERYGMVKNNRGWQCLSCEHIDKHSHQQSLREWFMLASNSISNRECRRFLRIDSSQLASRILNSMNLTREHKSKNTIYRWEW